ncbi:MAG TPA: bifunctional 4-hydroxy-2-oxoglutarate aldolase/2-dehydro-3-deoxy-phosphogluconate aldolase [Longimicrobiales bacterium]
MTTALHQLQTLRIVPVIVIEDANQAGQLADALVEGGLPCAEVTFRTAAAAEAIQRMRAQRPEMLVGAGTVLTVKQAADARSAGAQFIVSPGLNPAVVDDCQAHDIEIFPGVCTPTEIEMALGKGISTVKFFPAEPMGGLKFLKAIAAPYGMVNFIPTGGISTANIAEYLAFRKVVACGGSWMAPAEWIAAGQFDRIREETARAVASVGASVGAAR